MPFRTMYGLLRAVAAPIDTARLSGSILAEVMLHVAVSHRGEDVRAASGVGLDPWSCGYSLRVRLWVASLLSDAQ